MLNRVKETLVQNDSKTSVVTLSFEFDIDNQIYLLLDAEIDKNVKIYIVIKLLIT